MTANYKRVYLRCLQPLVEASLNSSVLALSQQFQRILPRMSVASATVNSLSISWLLLPYGALPARASLYLNECHSAAFFPPLLSFKQRYIFKVNVGGSCSYITSL